MLDVSAPFHCALMQPAADSLRHKLEATPFLPLQAQVVGNVHASPYGDSSLLQDILLRQVVEPVKWSQSVDYCIANNATSFLELGFGGVLTGLIKQHAPSSTCT